MPGIPARWLSPEGKKVSWLLLSEGCISMSGKAILGKARKGDPADSPHRLLQVEGADLDLQLIVPQPNWAREVES